MDLNDLPPELIYNILSYLNAEELVTFASTSKTCRSVVNDDYIWKQICEKEGISEIRNAEFSYQNTDLEPQCDWWVTYVESKLCSYFNWRLGRKETRTFERPYSDFLVAADEEGIAIANESGTISVYNSRMELLWIAEFIGDIESLVKWKDVVCYSGEEGVMLYRQDKHVLLDVWAEVHLLPVSGTVYVFDEDEGHIAGWSLKTLDMVSWLDYQFHFSDRLFSDDSYIYGIAPGWICLFNTGGEVASTLTVNTSSIMRMNGNENTIAGLFKKDRYSITLWSRSNSQVLKTIDINRPYCMKMHPFRDFLTYCSWETSSNSLSILDLNSMTSFNTFLDFDTIANAQINFIGKDLMAVFLRMDWEPYSKMIVCDISGTVLHTTDLEAKFIVYAGKGKVVLLCNAELQIIYFDNKF